MTLALAARVTPFHLNRSFTRCCAINDWLPLRKAEGKTPALLVLQRWRLSGVRYYSNHSVEVSRALSEMFGDWHLPASFTDFTVHLRQMVFRTDSAAFAQAFKRGSDISNKTCTDAVAIFEVLLWGSVFLQTLLLSWMNGRACSVKWCLMLLPLHTPYCVYNHDCILPRVPNLPLRALSFCTTYQYIMFYGWMHLLLFKV